MHIGGPDFRLKIGILIPNPKSKVLVERRVDGKLIEAKEIIKIPFY